MTRGLSSHEGQAPWQKPIVAMSGVRITQMTPLRRAPRPPHRADFSINRFALETMRLVFDR
jgi:hypothetical protein